MQCDGWELPSTLLLIPSEHLRQFMNGIPGSAAMNVDRQLCVLLQTLSETSRVLYGTVTGVTTYSYGPLSVRGCSTTYLL